MTGSDAITPSESNVVTGAVMQGAILAFVIVVPAAVLQLLIDVPTVRWLLFAVILAGFAAGGHRAAGLAPATPLTNAAIAALVAFAVAQGVAVVVSIAGGKAVPWTAIAFLALLATSSGMVGGVLALRQASRR